MFHADIMPIVTCFVYTSCHFYTFSGTNLLTRCHSASSCFLLFLYSRKASLEIFSELDENLRRRLFYQKTHGVQRGDGGAPRGLHTTLGRGQGCTRAEGACGPLGCPQPPPFRLLIPPVWKTLKRRVIFHEKFQSSAAIETKFRGSEGPVPAPCRDRD